MITKKKKKGKSYQAIFFSLFAAILIFGVIGFLIFSNLRINQKRAELSTRVKNLRQEIGVLEKKKQELETQASESGQESYLETVAREQLNLKKPGEEVVSVLFSEKEEEKEEIQEEKGFWQRVLEKIGF